MKHIGEPFSIQNTDQGWLVTWRNAVTSGTKDNQYEQVSFTVLIPRTANLSISEVQTFALKRAVELLQTRIQHSADRQKE